MLDADASKWRDNSAEHGNRARANVCFCCCLPCVTHLPVQFSAKGNDHSLGLFLLMFLLGPSCRDSSSRAGFSCIILLASTQVCKLTKLINAYKPPIFRQAALPVTLLCKKSCASLPGSLPIIWKAGRGRRGQTPSTLTTRARNSHPAALSAEVRRDS